MRVLQLVLAIGLFCAGIDAVHAQVIDATTIPEKELVPPAPKLFTGKFAAADLAQVPEVRLHESSSQVLAQLASINFLNKKKADHFLEVLRAQRPALAGLPFVRDEARRLQQAEREKFAAAVLNVREALRLHPVPSAFWSRGVKVPEDPLAVAALMQMLAAWSPGLVEHLSRCDQKEATQALAQIAIFGTEEPVRRLALTALQKRDTKPATEVLLKGLRYPWPPVAENAAQAVVQLGRADFAAELANMLNEPDPRAPHLQKINGQDVVVVRELVRINHLQNCLLCHPPGNLFLEKSFDVLTGEIPMPNQPAPLWSDGPDVDPNRLVRADVTYLRQDFSLMQKVADGSGPALQRFDYLVRQRVLTDEEARAYRESARGRKSSPYRQAALTALRGLNGQNSASMIQGKALWIALCGAGFLLLPLSLLGWFRR
jgi:hypothetical protein